MGPADKGSGSDPDPPTAPSDSGSQSYNTGTGDDRRKALDAILDYNKTLITLATGTLALSATFLGKELYRGQSVTWLVWSWIALGVSLFFGVIGMGAHVSQYAESRIQPRRSQSEYFSLVQFLALAAGLAMLGHFAIDNSTSQTITNNGSTSASTSSVPNPTRANGP